MPPLARPAHKSISPTTVLIAFTLFIFVSCSLINRQVNFYKIVSSRLNDQSYDIYIFTQNWPPSVCLSWEDKMKSHACFNAGNKTDWTIHGIWPTKLGTIGPAYCNLSLPFNAESIAGIKDELMDAWAPIEKKKKLNSFWKHEWEKHGTCATTVPMYPYEFGYFEQGLAWHKQHNLTSVLENGGIVPGKMYNVTAIWKTIKEAYGKNPHIVCFFDSTSKASYILEIRICFNKSLEIVDCDGIKVRSQWDYRHRRNGNGNFTDCSPNQLIEYPIIAPPPKTLDLYNGEGTVLMELLKTVEFLSWATS